MEMVLSIAGDTSELSISLKELIETIRFGVILFKVLTYLASVLRNEK
jgi:hypothetical protein